MSSCVPTSHNLIFVDFCFSFLFIGVLGCVYKNHSHINFKFVIVQEKTFPLLDSANFFGTFESSYFLIRKL